MKKVKEPKLPKQKKVSAKKTKVVAKKEELVNNDEFTDEEAMALKMQSLMDLSQSMDSSMDYSEDGDLSNEKYRAGI